MNEQLTFGFDESDSLAGFRLSRVEIFNWGTFHDKVWTLSPNEKNSLLTGDIGSGKSTLVDAVTTLLVPANRISYNKAAGADARERSLRSYVLGYYKTERCEGGFGAKPVALRGRNSYSVLLGVFKNQGYAQTVTLAQVFWQKDPGGQPNRFFLIADGDLSITEHFADFGTDIKNLKKKLKSLPVVDDIYESFPPYSASFRRRFGIENEQALELFHQTVSMKSVGNLTDFVRSHMLEAFEVHSRIDALIAHFDDLNRAHDAVVKSRRQIERLGPLVADLDKHADSSVRREELRLLRDGLRRYFAELKAHLVEKRLEHLFEDHARLTGRIDQLRTQHTQQQAEREQLRQAIADNGGDRLERLKSEIRTLTGNKAVMLQKSEEYHGLAHQVSIPSADSIETFLRNRRLIADMLCSVEQEETEVQNARTEAEVEMRSSRDAHATISGEIDSLQNRRSNIDSRQIQIRADLCRSLGVGEETIPFAGELLQVRPEEESWEGAIERILRNFGLSLLVPDNLYARVSDWVDKTDLRGRVVYFKVSLGRAKGTAEQHPNSLARKISIKPDSEFYSWLGQELGHRFDYACCETMDSFRREKQAITIAGQIKGSGNRHEKDDRHPLWDRSRYVLGWSNEAKLATLRAQRAAIEKRIQDVALKISKLLEEQKRSGTRRTQLGKLEGFSRFEEIDWRPLVLRIQALDEERRSSKRPRTCSKRSPDSSPRRNLCSKKPNRNWMRRRMKNQRTRKNRIRPGSFSNSAGSSSPIQTKTRTMP